MKAVQVQNGFGFDSLALVDRPDPQPGPYQALVQVKAVSLNYRDLLMVRGSYNPRQKLPLIPCSDAVGVVAAVGPGVTRVKPGDRVASLFAQGWIAGELTPEKFATTLGGPSDGVLAEQVVLHEHGLVHVPGHLTDEEAATLPCAAVTAWSAFLQGQLKAGDVVLVQGTGGVSLFALQLARLLGARVIITSSSDEKLARARALGASEGINYKQTPEWGKAARDLTGGVGVDHIVEVGGAGTLEQSLRAIRMNGQISLIGVLAGGNAQLALFPLFMRNVRVQGIFVGSRETFESMNKALAFHQLRPVVDRVFSLGESRAAFEYMASGAHFGKVCIRL